MKKIEFTKPFRYARKLMKSGDTVTAETSVARTLVALGKAKYVHADAGKGGKRGAKGAKTPKNTPKKPPQQRPAPPAGDSGENNPAPGTDTTGQTPQ